MVGGDLEPAHPIVITLVASSEAIDALLGTKRGSPRVMPDETKLAVTDCASRGVGRSKIFKAAGHYCLLLVYRSYLPIIPSSPSHFMSMRVFTTHAA
jgi:hypothetical protein